MKDGICSGCPEYRRLLEKVRHDSLTGLLGREEFERRAKEVINQSTVVRAGDAFEVSVCFVAMDDLKLINDRYGHHVGDAAIIYLARVLVTNVRPSDIVARYSCEKRADEFGIVFPRTSLSEARAVVRRIRRALYVGEFFMDGIRLTVRSSFGTASTAQGFRTFEELFKEADRRMYRYKHRAKRWGRRVHDRD